MRALGERFRRQFPHLLEGRIVQPQPPVAGEHRDRFGEIVERLALHADQRVEAALEIEPLGHVVEQIGDAAFGIGRGDDAQRAAVRQMPHVLLRLRARDRLRAAGSSSAEILLLRQLAGGAQAVEQRGIGRPVVEKGGVEIPQHAIGGVVEAQRLVGAEDGDAGGELVERAAMRIDHARHFGAHAFDLGGVDRRRRRCRCGSALRPRRRCAARRRRRPARGRDRARRRSRIRAASSRAARSSNSRFALDRVGRLLRFDRAGIGRIDEIEPAVAVARPDRGGQRIDQGAQRGHVVEQAVMPGGQRRRVRPSMPLTSRSRITARPPMARPSASIGLAAERGQRHREAFAGGAQRVDRLLHASAPDRAAATMPKASTRCGMVAERHDRRRRR